MKFLGLLNFLPIPLQVGSVLLSMVLFYRGREYFTIPQPIFSNVLNSKSNELEIESDRNGKGNNKIVAKAVPEDISEPKQRKYRVNPYTDNTENSTRYEEEINSNKAKEAQPIKKALDKVLTTSANRNGKSSLCKKKTLAEVFLNQTGHYKNSYEESS